MSDPSFIRPALLIGLDRLGGELLDRLARRIQSAYAEAMPGGISLVYCGMQPPDAAWHPAVQPLVIDELPQRWFNGKNDAPLPLVDDWLTIERRRNITLLPVALDAPENRQLWRLVWLYRLAHQPDTLENFFSHHIRQVLESASSGSTQASRPIDIYVLGSVSEPAMLAWCWDVLHLVQHTARLHDHEYRCSLYVHLSESGGAGWQAAAGGAFLRELNRFMEMSAAADHRRLYPVEAGSLHRMTSRSRLLEAVRLYDHPATLSRPADREMLLAQWCESLMMFLDEHIGQQLQEAETNQYRAEPISDTLLVSSHAARTVLMPLDEYIRGWTHYLARDTLRAWLVSSAADSDVAEAVRRLTDARTASPLTSQPATAPGLLSTLLSFVPGAAEESSFASQVKGLPVDALLRGFGIGETQRRVLSWQSTPAAAMDSVNETTTPEAFRTDWQKQVQHLMGINGSRSQPAVGIYAQALETAVQTLSQQFDAVLVGQVHEHLAQRGPVFVLALLERLKQAFRHMLESMAGQPAATLDDTISQWQRSGERMKKLLVRQLPNPIKPGLSAEAQAFVRDTGRLLDAARQVLHAQAVMMLVGRWGFSVEYLSRAVYPYARLLQDAADWFGRTAPTAGNPSPSEVVQPQNPPWAEAQYRRLVRAGADLAQRWHWQWRSTQPYITDGLQLVLQLDGNSITDAQSAVRHWQAVVERLIRFETRHENLWSYLRTQGTDDVIGQLVNALAPLPRTLEYDPTTNYQNIVPETALLLGISLDSTDNAAYQTLRQSLSDALTRRLSQPVAALDSGTRTSVALLKITRRIPLGAVNAFRHMHRVYEQRIGVQQRAALHVLPHEAQAARLEIESQQYGYSGELHPLVVELLGQPHRLELLVQALAFGVVELEENHLFQQALTKEYHLRCGTQRLELYQQTGSDFPGNYMVTLEFMLLTSRWRQIQEMCSPEAVQALITQAVAARSQGSVSQTKPEVWSLMNRLRGTAREQTAYQQAVLAEGLFVQAQSWVAAYHARSDTARYERDVLMVWVALAHRQVEQAVQTLRGLLRIS